MSKMTDREKAEHNAVVNDIELERGEHPIGKLVHISTVTHAFRGILLAVTPSYYILDGKARWAIVDSTGPMSNYVVDMAHSDEGDEVKQSDVHVRILRGATSWMLVSK